jgi:hypothetical protein
VSVLHDKTQVLGDGEADFKVKRPTSSSFYVTYVTYFIGWMDLCLNGMVLKYFVGVAIIFFMSFLVIFSRRSKFDLQSIFRNIYSLNKTIAQIQRNTYSLNETMTQIQRHANAFVISKCNSARYNFTIYNLGRGFPKFFNFICHEYPTLNDPRIHTSPDLVAKKISSNLIAFTDIWTYEIPNHSKYEHEWSFVFEDDVNIVEPFERLLKRKVSLSNYNEILIGLMHHDEVRNIHGFFYLGICGPIFEKTDRPIKTVHSIIHHYNGYGSCAHAMATTKKRSRNFWSDLASFRPNNDDAMDTIIKAFSIRSSMKFYTLGANIEMPKGTGQFGIVYQDRRQFKTTLW